MSGSENAFIIEHHSVHNEKTPIRDLLFKWLEIIVGNLRGTDQSEHQCTDGWIILEWILGKWVR
jgi:hypothetical protein